MVYGYWVIDGVWVISVSDVFLEEKLYSEYMVVGS